MRSMSTRLPMFYPREIIKLFLSTLAVFLVFAGEYFPRSILEGLVIFFLSFTIYVPHELAHKFVAQHFGYPARYTINLGMFFLTLLSAIPYIPIKFIAPGAVYIYAITIDKKTNGLISIAGPATNIFLGLVALSGGGPLGVSIARLNGWIAFFNLLPIGPLDGLKVMRWNMPLWIIFLAISFWMGFLV
jgi:Zn-dependent protease